MNDLWPGGASGSISREIEGLDSRRGQRQPQTGHLQLHRVAKADRRADDVEVRIDALHRLELCGAERVRDALGVEVVDHRIERPRHRLPLDAHVIAVVDELGSSLRRARDHAAVLARLIAGAARERRPREHDRNTVDPHRSRAPCGIRRHCHVDERNRASAVGHRADVAHGKRDTARLARDDLAPIDSHRTAHDIPSRGHTSPTYAAAGTERHTTSAAAMAAPINRYLYPVTEPIRWSVVESAHPSPRCILLKSPRAQQPVVHHPDRLERRMNLPIERRAFTRVHVAQLRRRSCLDHQPRRKIMQCDSIFHQRLQSGLASQLLHERRRQQREPIDAFDRVLAGIGRCGCGSRLRSRRTASRSAGRRSRSLAFS